MLQRDGGSGANVVDGVSEVARRVGPGRGARSRRCAVSHLHTGASMRSARRRRTVPFAAPGTTGEHPLDRARVLAERAVEALRELVRREVRGLGAQLPDAVGEAHLVQARDAAGVEVVLKEAVTVGAGADDRDAVGGDAAWDLPQLDSMSLPPAARSRRGSACS
jgi:hypothetical protein